MTSRREAVGGTVDVVGVADVVGGGIRDVDGEDIEEDRVLLTRAVLVAAEVREAPVHVV